MAGTETWQMLMFFNRNPNALDGKQRIPAGTDLAPGLYWDVSGLRVVPVSQPQPAAGDFVKLSDRLDATLDQITRTFALGGGGRQGEPVPDKPHHS
ncbi:MAG: hypothetical protein HY329_25905 [Chloroflexi bacterium]|nr:hypothetical protein [Chloroflexota bacterium]